MKKILAMVIALGTMVSCCNSEKMTLAGEGLSWKLASMEGITEEAINSEEGNFAMQFNAKEGMLAGRTNCNTFFGKYTDENGKLTFSEMGMTRMMCPDMTQEDVFMQALSTVDNYTIEGDVLTLKAGEKAVASFKAKFAEKAHCEKAACPHKEGECEGTCENCTSENCEKECNKAEAQCEKNCEKAEACEKKCEEAAHCEKAAQCEKAEACTETEKCKKLNTECKVATENCEKQCEKAAAHCEKAEACTKACNK